MFSGFAFLYLFASLLGVVVILPGEDIALVERAVWVHAEHLPVGTCGQASADIWPGGRVENATIEIAEPSLVTGCNAAFLRTVVIHEVGHIVCFHRYLDWIQAAPKGPQRDQRHEECAWWYTWLHMPNQPPVTVFLPPDYEPVFPVPDVPPVVP